MGDRFATNRGYYPMITTDLESGEFRMLDESEFSMPTDEHKYRHGYVMPVTAAEYDALQRAYGDDDYVSTYKLEQTIASAETIDMNALTEASKADLQAAIATAKAALESVKTTADADAAAAELQKVIDALEYTGGETVTLTGISVTPPTTTTYTAGDELNLDGLKVTAAYSDNNTKDVTENADVDTSACNMDEAGTYTVTVSYTENGVTKTDTFDITVKDAAVEPGDVTLTGIEVTVPDNTTFTVGDKLDLTGLKVTASYSNSSTKDVTDSENLTVDTAECNMDAAGTYTVKVSYTENGITMSDTFQIKVNEKEEPAQPTDPDQETPEPSERPGNPQNPGTSAPAPGAGYEGGGTVQTGDTTNVLPIAAACVLALGCGVTAVVLKRRKRY